MSGHETLIDLYIAAWNERDPAHRRELVARGFAADARYLDPVLRAEGHEGISAMLAEVQARFPGLRFRRMGAADAHNDRLRFRWGLGPENGEAVAEGTDFATLAPDGRLREVTGFFDKLPEAAAEQPPSAA